VAQGRHCSASSGETPFCARKLATCLMSRLDFVSGQASGYRSVSLMLCTVSRNCFSSCLYLCGTTSRVAAVHRNRAQSGPLHMAVPLAFRGRKAKRVQFPSIWAV
jgi:hypothetical protein